MSDICIITKDDILPNIRPLDWDIVISDKPYTIAHLEGFVHSHDDIWGDNDVWAWPRPEMPNHRNLIPYHGRPGATWGIRYEPTRIKKNRYEGAEELHTVSIIRNGRVFYQFQGSMHDGFILAEQHIHDIRNHPIPFDTVRWRGELIGRDIWWNDEPAEIIDYVNRQASIIIQPSGIKKFTLPPEEEDKTKELIVKTTIFNKQIDWIRYPGEKER